MGVKFFYIYKSLAHPETNGFVTPFNLEERLMHIAEAQRTLGSRFGWICDTMQNDLKHALGDRPNSEFIVDPDGKILVARAWSDPKQLREDLSRIVGPVENPTSVNDLRMPRQPPPARAVTGVVDRVKLPGRMTPLKLTPVDSKIPFYAKLRAEWQDDNLYLGFYLDPLYKVHWNNKAPAIQFEVIPPKGVTVTPSKGSGPKVDVDADADPREFLIKLDGTSDQPLEVTVKYFACDDAETFCIPVTQQYLVWLTQDRDGGSRRSSGGPEGGRQRPPGGRPDSMRSPRDRPARQNMVMRMFLQNDRNADGKLVGDEIPPPMRQRLSRLDANGDGVIERSEIEQTAGRRGGGR